MPFDISYYYRGFQDKYFGMTVPNLSADFVCIFQKLPYDVAGITLLGEDAARVGVTEGIRLNEKLKEFPAEARVALLHEMIHATGLRGHGDELKHAMGRLWGLGAYLDPLIL